MLSVEADKADALIKNIRSILRLISQQTYSSQTVACEAVAVRCMLVVTDKMDEKTSYRYKTKLFSPIWIV